MFIASQILSITMMYFGETNVAFLRNSGWNSLPYGGTKEEWGLCVKQHNWPIFKETPAPKLTVLVINSKSFFITTYSNLDFSEFIE